MSLFPLRASIRFDDRHLAMAILLCDIFIAISAPYAGWLIRNFFVGLRGLGSGFYFYAAWSAISTLILLRLSGSFGVAWRFFSVSDALEAFVAVAMGVSVAAIGSFLFDRLDSVPRSLLFIHVLFQFASYVLVRLYLRRFVDHASGRRRRPVYVLLVGCNEVANIYIRAVESVGRGSLKVAAVLTHDPTMVGKRMRGIPIVSLVDNIETAIGQLNIRGIEINRIVVCAGASELGTREIDTLTDVAGRNNLIINDIHSLFSEVAGPVGLNEDFDVEEITLSDAYWIVKRCLDFFGAIALLFLLSPLFVVTTFLVWIDVGRPFFFWQERPGRHGVVMRVFKFRTMRDVVRSDGAAVPDQSRTSRIGFLLRKLRLDELPQLWNILKGDMSFIGPRPLLFEDQPKEVARRLAVRPGLSGWAQVNGGKLVSREEKRALDLWYIAHVSFMLEMWIVVLTLRVIIRGDVERPHAVRSAVNWLRKQESIFTIEDHKGLLSK